MLVGTYSAELSLCLFWASFYTPVTVQFFGTHGKMMSEKRDFRVEPTCSYGLFLEILFYKMFCANMFLFISFFDWSIRFKVMIFALDYLDSDWCYSVELRSFCLSWLGLTQLS